MKTMKTILTTVAAALVVGSLAACNSKPSGALADNVQATSDNVSSNPPAQSWLQDSIVEDLEMGHVAVYMEHPADTSSLTSQTITEYMSEMLGGMYNGPYTSPHDVMAYYHGDQKAQLKPDYDELKAARGDDNVKFTWNVKFRKTAETAHYFTYEYSYESYLGGAHGMYSLFGVTFRKSDMRRMGWEILRNYADENLQKLMRRGLREYFNVKTDDELKDMFFNQDNIYTLQLPQCPPLFTDKGIMFVYNPYEIAPYAAGMPMFTIPYASIKPYLITTALKLVEK